MKRLTAEKNARMIERKMKAVEEAGIFSEVCQKCDTTIPVPSEVQHKMKDFIERGSNKHTTQECYLQSEWVKQKLMDTTTMKEFKVTCPNPDCQAHHVVRLTIANPDVDVAG